MKIRDIKVRSYGFTATIESHLLTDDQLKHLGIFYTRASDSLDLPVEGSFEVDEYDPGEQYLTLSIFDICVYSPDLTKNVYIDSSVDLYDLEQRILELKGPSIVEDAYSSAVSNAYDRYKDK